MLTFHFGGRGTILHQSMKHFWQIGTEIGLCSEHHGFPPGITLPPLLCTHLDLKTTLYQDKRENSENLH